MTVQLLCTFERKYYEEFMAQYKEMDADVLDETEKFIIYTKTEKNGGGF